MAARRQGLFSLYIYKENFKCLLVRNHWTDFSILGRNVSVVTLYQIYSSCHDSSENMAARGRGLFSLYICIKQFRKLLVRNHWTDSNITYQKCSFGDPLSRFSSSCHDALKSMATMGQGYKIYAKILEQ